MAQDRSVLTRGAPLQRLGVGDSTVTATWEHVAAAAAAACADVRGAIGYLGVTVHETGASGSRTRLLPAPQPSEAR